MSMPAGRYFVGDLCYVMHPEWDEVCDLTIVGNQCLNGEFQLADGRRFAFYHTAYGDGTYRSNFGTSHSVDAGLIGVFKVEDIRDETYDENYLKELGAFVEFESDFETGSDANGDIYFGNIVIPTGYDEDEDDGEDYGYEIDDDD